MSAPEFCEVCACPVWFRAMLAQKRLALGFTATSAELCTYFVCSFSSSLNTFPLDA